MGPRALPWTLFIHRRGELTTGHDVCTTPPPFSFRFILTFELNGDRNNVTISEWIPAGRARFARGTLLKASQSGRLPSDGLGSKPGVSNGGGSPQSGTPRRSVAVCEGIQM